MNLLAIIQEFCRRQGLQVPLLLFTSNDDQFIQLVGLANEICEDLVRRHTWTELQFESVFTSVAGSDQGALTTLAPYAFLKILNDTIFDRTRRLPLFGPRAAPQWQAIKALPVSGPFYQYRIQQGKLWVTPDMPAGNQLAFEYSSKGVVRNAAGTLASSAPYFTADTDTFVLDPALLLLGLRWRWREDKGLPYLEAFRLYEMAVAEAAGADGTKSALAMDGASGTAQPGIFIPSGNWSLS